MTAPTDLSGLLLLCVDLQPVFLRAVSSDGRLERRCAFAIEAATGLGIDALFTEQVPTKLGGTAANLAALAPRAAALAKTTFSAFADPAIRATVADRRTE